MLKNVAHPPEHGFRVARNDQANVAPQSCQQRRLINVDQRPGQQRSLFFSEMPSPPAQ
jgi:hypothetical protein